MTEVILAASELQAVCETQGWRFCFIGGLAVQRWGQPRETVDADLTLLAGFGNEAPFINTLLQHFSGRIPDAAQFALERRVRQTGKLDWNYIREQLLPLAELKESPDMIDRLEQMRVEVESP